ncbi:hypothetical protein R3P38DRAFT_2849808 [Favolaschia claudopus]|uniref:Uncharacterized protein n=1 Tax=Favolaschia claudopus TaxID=2862362 RepID=A0AAW0DWK7_9AGAR
MIVVLFLNWLLYFLVWSDIVGGHILGRNTAATPPKEIELPPLPSTLHVQASSFNFDLEKALPPASSTLAQLADLPSNCALEQGAGGECSQSSMVATNVTYEDCGDAFTICRCNDANMTMDIAVDRLARVPVGLRRFVGTAFVLGDATTHAYTNLSTGDIHLFGDSAMDTWIHEASHAFDFSSSYSVPSSSDAWQDAISNDTCVPDRYSLLNRVENFAQMSVIKIYMLLHSGNLPPGFQADCMSKQLDFMDSLPLYNANNLFGNTCAIDPPGARKTNPPALLDASRTFMTVSLDPTPNPSETPTRPSSALSWTHGNSVLRKTCLFVAFYLIVNLM